MINQQNLIQNTIYFYIDEWQVYKIIEIKYIGNDYITNKPVFFIPEKGEGEVSLKDLFLTKEDALSYIDCQKEKIQRYYSNLINTPEELFEIMFEELNKRKPSFEKNIMLTTLEEKAEEFGIILKKEEKDYER